METTHTGSRYATSAQGTLTGRGGDWIIIDDPMKQSEAESETIPINPKEEKLIRVQAITPFLERGEVLLPEHAPWVDEFLAETATYPQGRHDDQVDALAQYLGWLPKGTRHTAGILKMTGGHKSVGR